MNLDGESFRSYLFRSAFLHLGLLFGFFFIARHPLTPPSEVYRIDFIGPSNVIINRNQESVEAAPSQASPATGPIAPESQKDEFAAHPRHAPLPRPSILNPSHETPKTPSPAVSVPKPQTDSASTEGGGEAAVSADMPNFPYPWYISQIRAALWNQWSSKNLGKSEEVTVEFSILKEGSAVDVRIESSSGDQEIDYVALGAVQGAMPFPPLPAGFQQQFLKVHVRFKSQ